MTEYWKSYAKKYCDVCKCWITDNKASVQFHENGKRHKENVSKKISEMVKRATEEGKEKKELDEDMKRMEEAALKAYMKDVEANPDHSAQFVKERLDERKKQEPFQAESSSSMSKDQDDKLKDPGAEEYVSQISQDRVWYEAKSEQGYSYYWNIHTNESVWEAPEGFVSVKEQDKEEERKKTFNGKTDKQNEVKEAEKFKKKKEEVDAAVQRELNRKKYNAEPVNKSDEEDQIEEEEEDEESATSIGPQTKADPYGAWTTVVTEVRKPVDLQLPPSYQPVIQPAAYTTVEPKVKIKEKTLDPSKLDSSDGPSSFKKRKITNRGNTRQRFDNDD